MCATWSLPLQANGCFLLPHLSSCWLRWPLASLLQQPPAHRGVLPLPTLASLVQSPAVTHTPLLTGHRASERSPVGQVTCRPGSGLRSSHSCPCRGRSLAGLCPPRTGRRCAGCGTAVYARREVALGKQRFSVGFAVLVEGMIRGLFSGIRPLQCLSGERRPADSSLMQMVF